MLLVVAAKPDDVPVAAPDDKTSMTVAPSELPVAEPDKEAEEKVQVLNIAVKHNRNPTPSVGCLGICEMSRLLTVIGSPAGIEYVWAGHILDVDSSPERGWTRIWSNHAHRPCECLSMTANAAPLNSETTVPRPSLYYTALHQVVTCSTN